MSKYLTVADVADRLGFTPKTIRLWCARGIFPGAAKWPDNGPTSEWRIPSEDVEALVRERTSPTVVSRNRLDDLMNAAIQKAGV